MAHGDGPDAPQAPAMADDTTNLRALAQRVDRLESELRDVRHGLARAMAASTPFRTEELVPVPPPPFPTSMSVAAGPAGEAFLPEAKAPRSRDSLESRLGSQIFNRIGIVLLLTGTAWFLKLAVDRRWIVPSPMGRLLLGLIAGAAIVLWSERFRRKGFAAFSYSLKALGSGVLYLSLWAGFQLFHLLPAGWALGLMILVTAWNAYMAWVQDAELLAAYALTGGFLTPLLVSNGGNHETFLFSYLLAIDLAAVLLVRLRRWPRLLLGAFPLTMAFFIAWYSEFFTAAHLAETTVFILLFDSTFSSVPLWLKPRAEAAARLDRSTVIEDILVPLANGAFLSMGLYSVLQDSGHAVLLPWLMVALSATYLAFVRLPQRQAAAAIHLSLGIVFLTIAVPLKVGGHWITVSWLVEGLALLWVAARLRQDQEDAAPRTLRWLGCAALGLGFCGVLGATPDGPFSTAQTFFNADMATVLTGTAVFAMTGWLALYTVREQRRDVRAWSSIAHLAYIASALTGLQLTLQELVGTTSRTSPHGAFRSVTFFTALLGLGILSACLAAALRLAQTAFGNVSSEPERFFWTRAAAASIVAFNLVAVRTGVREVASIWDGALSTSSGRADATLQQALAVSGFLMLYGAVLLAVGFWRRTAFVRWQALALLVFTILKTSLYDMRSLSQGYRVVSFLALGTLLLAISFAYQKDWLNLRAPQIDEPMDAAGPIQ